ncbi:MAG: hypothetical protein GX638_07150 [Crenarchaeota archaeon]|nr:hypothetical protein [Thermoproteota archaeon]
MERANVIKEEIVREENQFLAVYVEAKNSCLIMLSENEDRMGTLAIAVPKPTDVLGPVTSSILVGDKNGISARTFAEYIAAKKGKIALVSIYLDKVSESQAHKYFSELIEKVFQKETKKQLVKL